MLDARKEHVQRLQEAVNGNGYQVDSAAVAEAIVRRLMAGRALPKVDRR